MISNLQLSCLFELVKVVGNIYIAYKSSSQKLHMQATFIIYSTWWNFYDEIRGAVKLIMALIKSYVY